MGKVVVADETCRPSRPSDGPRRSSSRRPLVGFCKPLGMEQSQTSSGDGLSAGWPCVWSETCSYRGLDEELRTIKRENLRGCQTAYLRSELSLTEFGKAILAHKEDFSRHNPIDRWWGGTRLTNDRLWRWGPILTAPAKGRWHEALDLHHQQLRSRMPQAARYRRHGDADRKSLFPLGAFAFRRRDRQFAGGR